MKKYNSFLGAFFSGDSGQGGYNAAYGKSALAKLYTSQDPAEQQMAAEGLARVDPESAGKWQQEQTALRQEGLKRKATMIANAPPAQRGQLYSAVLPDIRKDWAEAPEQYTPELDQMVTAWAQSVTGGGNKDKYSGAPFVVMENNKPVYYRYGPGGVEATGLSAPDQYQLIEGRDGYYRVPTKRPGDASAVDVGQGDGASTPTPAPTTAPVGSGGVVFQDDVQGAAQRTQNIMTQVRQEIAALVAQGVPVDQATSQVTQKYAQSRGLSMPSSGQSAPPVNQPAPPPVATGGEARLEGKPIEQKVETWSQPTSVIKNGKPVMIQTSNQGNERERPDLAPADSTKAPTQDQSNAAGFYSRMQQSERIISQIEAEGYSPAANKGDFFSAGGTFTNWATSPKGQKYYNAATNWIRANLRKESGAAIGVDEAKQEYSTYFPIPGDTKDTIEQKRQLRQQTIEAVRGAGMPAMKYQDNQNQRAPAGKVNDPLGILK
jgi:hypothetical protein